MKVEKVFRFYQHKGITFNFIIDIQLYQLDYNGMGPLCGA